LSARSRTFMEPHPSHDAGVIAMRVRENHPPFISV
jgi:hypothetical protein